MACRKCGSDWTTPKGKDCNRCPHCDKQQLFQARKAGRWVEPVVVKQCECCGREFEAIGLKQIKQRVLCGDEECAKQHRKDGFKRRAAGVYVQRQVHGVSKPDRFCKRCGKGPLARDQKGYCGKQCFFEAVNAGEQRFVGRVHDAWAGLVDWAYDWKDEYQKIVPCLACGALLQNTTGQRKFCNEACRYRFEKPLHKECLDCGCTLNANTRYVRRCRLCSSRRRLARGKVRGRCRRHGVPFDSSVKSVLIFERDAYVCQLCAKKCLSTFTLVNGKPHPLSPTVDHIIAIAMGIKGHTWDNVQCACWQCNVKKGKQAKGQLRLVMS